MQDKLEQNLAKRAEHYFSENMRVMKGIILFIFDLAENIFEFQSYSIMSKPGREAWALGKLEDFGKLVTASGLSSIRNYECGI